MSKIRSSAELWHRATCPPHDRAHARCVHPLGASAHRSPLLSPVFQQPGVRALELGEVERHVHGEVSSKQVVYFIRLIQPKASGAAVMKVAR